jgi:hypothetical protein
LKLCPSALPAGPPPVAGEGSEFIDNPLPCLSDAQKAILAAALRAGAAALLGLQASQLKILPKQTSVGGGALNVELAASGGGSLPVTPLAQTLSSPLYDPIFEPGFNTQIRADGVVPVGPGTSYHVVFNTGADAQGQQVITGIIRAHADIGNPATGGLGRHVKGDVFGATIFSVMQGGIPGCAVKFD